MIDINDFCLDNIALMITSGALILSLYQLRKSQKDSKKIISINSKLESQIDFFKTQNKELLYIKESISTKYLGVFPNFVDKTIDMLLKAKTSIEIMCDFPSYCYFSDYKKHVKYSSIISTKEAAGVGIKLTCPNEEKRKELIYKQFNITKDDSWKKKSPTQEKLIEFIEHERLSCNIDNITPSDFLEQIENVNLLSLQTTFKNSYDEVSCDVPVYYWIIDNSEAIFSIPSYFEYTREQGFSTFDRDLIESLKTMSKDLTNANN